ncbi:MULTISPECIES: hypothetical protein [unclassified Polaromonas]|uniref:hypothetical protein n=1 Tax=unclassified Polaromonas TaxID=2638319 RepID=UPI0018C96A7D|nr:MULTISPECIES: hypothetical protein [unclassified Polaromonas]MBG6073148.1 hypothetical protein [Polaromonas sp. CG_9.7]MBG6115152.1 hypothetical protein [Polaromonas sp. CG_9.2]MDH6184981.1 hypothetical protein [Polaromonas sp. CG_23.6]
MEKEVESSENCLRDEFTPPVFSARLGAAGLVQSSGTACAGSVTVLKVSPASAAVFETGCEPGADLAFSLGNQLFAAENVVPFFGSMRFCGKLSIVSALGAYRSCISSYYFYSI